MYWINILHCELAQNELKVYLESFCDYLFDSQSVFKFLSDVRKLRLISIKIPTRHLVILRKSPKLTDRAEMNNPPFRVSSGVFTVRC